MKSLIITLALLGIVYSSCSVLDSEMCQGCDVTNGTICNYCYEGYYDSTTATCVKGSLSNCKYQSSATVCSVCHEDHYLNSTGTTCTLDESIDDCVSPY